MWLLIIPAVVFVGSLILVAELRFRSHERRRKEAAKKKQA